MTLSAYTKPSNCLDVNDCYSGLIELGEAKMLDTDVSTRYEGKIARLQNRLNKLALKRAVELSKELPAEIKFYIYPGVRGSQLSATAMLQDDKTYAIKTSFNAGTLQPIYDKDAMHTFQEQYPFHLIQS